MNPSPVLLARPGSRRASASLMARTLWTLATLEVRIRHRSVTSLCRSYGLVFHGFTTPDVEPRPLAREVLHQWWAVEGALKWWPWGRSRPCLRRSIVLGALVGAPDPGLCLEVTSVRPFAAHAWLLVEGQRLDMGSWDEQAVPRGESQ